MSFRSSEGANCAIKPSILSKTMFFCEAVLRALASTVVGSFVRPRFVTDALCQMKSGSMKTANSLFWLKWYFRFDCQSAYRVTVSFSVKVHCFGGLKDMPGFLRKDKTRVGTDPLSLCHVTPVVGIAGR